MRSATSYFNSALLRRNLVRFWPLWFSYALIWLLIEPVYLLTDISRSYAFTGAQHRLTAAMFHVTSFGIYGGYVMAGIFGIFFAMAMFSYLTSPKATQGCHAMPVRRETLFVTNYATGLVCMLAVLVLSFLLTGTVGAAYGCGIWRQVGLSLSAAALQMLFFYSFGVFCMMFTGQILAAPVFYGVLNIYAVAAEWLVNNLAGSLLYGGSGEKASLRLKWFSPLCAMLEKTEVSYVYPEVYSAEKGVYVSDFSGDATGVAVRGIGLLAVYAAVGLLLTVLALMLYRRRRSESAGTTVAVEWARPVFQYGVTLSSALSLGQLIYYMFFGQRMNNGAYSLCGVIVSLLFTALLGFYASEMLLHKSLRVFRSSRKRACAVALAAALLGALLPCDPMGFETRIPAPEEVEWASVAMSGTANYTCAALEAPQELELLTQVHRTVVADKKTQQQRSAENGGTPYRSDEDSAYVWLRINYILRDGGSLSRWYQLYILRDELEQPDSTASMLTRLYTCAGMTKGRILNFGGEKHRESAEPVFLGGSCTSFDDERGEVILTAMQAENLYRAVLSDLALDRADGSLFDEDNNFGMVHAELYLLENDGDSGVYYVNKITPEMTETVAALRSAGLTVGFSQEDEKVS